MPQRAVAQEEQTAFDEERLDNADLEALLEKRQGHNEEKKKVTKAFKQADRDAQVSIAGLKLAVDARIRVGRFVIKKKKVTGGDREFNVPDREQVSIGLAKE